MKFRVDFRLLDRRIMALVYSRQAGATRYEIRSAGRTMRLYTNGVLHTQYHPERRVTGGVWDLLALPALALTDVKRVLLLGLCGGAAVHLLRDWCPGVHITAVELNPMHLKLARRFFGIEGQDLTLVQDDALAWAACYQGAPFDLGIGDLFLDETGDPQRTLLADRDWSQTLGNLVNHQGALVMNTLAPKQLSRTALLRDPEVHRKWASHLCLTLPAYANAVGAFFRRAVTVAELRAAIRSDPRRWRQERSGQLRYDIRHWTPKS